LAPHDAAVLRTPSILPTSDAALTFLLEWRRSVWSSAVLFSLREACRDLWRYGHADGRDDDMINRALLAFRLDRFLSLPPRQQEIARLYGEGLTLVEIAQQCCIQPQTVKNHLTYVYKGLGFNSTRKHHASDLGYLMGFIDGMETNRLRIVVHKQEAA
jgi:DNA-binding CsgD family transcriptional regulator